MLLKEVVKNGDDVLEQLEDLPRVDPRILWHYDYYDGALSGVCEFDNSQYWFEWIGEVPICDNDGDFFSSRVYAVVEMTEDQLRLERASHDSFCKFVRDPPWWLRVLRKLGMNIHDLHYKSKPPRPDYSNNTVVAWRVQGLWNLLSKDEMAMHYLRLYRELTSLKDPESFRADDLRDHMDILWKGMTAAHKAACEKQLDAEKKAS